MAIGVGTTIGEAYIRIRPTATGFEAEVLAEVTPGLKAVEKAATLRPTVDTSRTTGPLNLLKSKLASFAGKNPLTSALNDVETAAGGAGSGLSGLAGGGVAIAGAAITAFALKGVADFQHLAGEVRNFQRVTGASAESSSQFVASFRAIGTDVASATQALGRFGKNLEVNAAGLEGMGVQIARTKSGATDITGTFLNVADAIHNSSDAGARNTLVLQAFGRAGLSLLPILSKGRAGIEELFGEAAKRHELLSQDDLDKARALSLATIALKEEFTGLEREAGKALVPFITSLVQAATGTLGLIDKIGAAIGQVTSLGGLDKPIAEKIAGKKGDTDSFSATLKDFFNVVLHGSEYADKALKDLGTTSTMTEEDQIALAQAATDATTAMAEQQKGIDALTGATLGVSAAQRDLASANRAVDDATTNLASSQRALSLLGSQSAADAKLLAAANKDLAVASRGVADAQRSVTDATTARNDAERALSDLLSGRTQADEATKHTHDLEHAQLGVRSSTLSLRDAQGRLLALQNDTTSSAEDLANAQLQVDQANLTLIESQENLSGTQDDLNRLQQIGAENSPEVVAARTTLDGATRTLATSQQALTDALDAETIARGKVATAQQGDAAFAATLVAAHKSVQTAQESLAGATAAASEKAKDLFDKQTALNGAMAGGLPNLQAVKENLERIVALQPQAAGFLGPTLDQINALIAGALAILSAPTNINLKAGTGAGFDRGKGQQAFATGGFATGSFIAGEDGPERIDLMAGGGAQVTPSSRTSVGGHTFNVNISASFGPGAGYDDVLRGMRDVANGVMADTLQRVVAKAAAK